LFFRNNLKDLSERQYCQTSAAKAHEVSTLRLFDFHESFAYEGMTFCLKYVLKTAVVS